MLLSEMDGLLESITQSSQVAVANTPETLAALSHDRPWLSSDSVYNFNYHAPGQIAQLDWVGGFATSGALRLETFFKPVLPCLGMHDDGRLRCDAVSRTNLPLVKIDQPLRRTTSLIVDRYYRMGATLEAFMTLSSTKVLRERPLSYQEHELTITDATSMVLAFRELSQLEPELARAVEHRGPCPPSVGFYVTRSAGTTYVIPTFSILMSCYMPSGGPYYAATQLYKYLMNPKARQFSSDTVVFNGLQFVFWSQDKSVFCYPVRATRYLARAEREISQLLPRATAYYYRHGDHLPILIRPPFLGVTRVSGYAFTTQGSDGRPIVVFTHGVWFHPEHSAPAKNFRKVPELELDMHFLEPSFPFAPAPRCDGVFLPYIQALALGPMPLRYDVRKFTGATRRLEDMIRSGSLIVRREKSREQLPMQIDYYLLRDVHDHVLRTY